MPEAGATEAASEMSMELRVIRCGCGKPATHCGKPCPAPRETVDVDPQQIIVVDTKIGA